MKLSKDKQNNKEVMITVSMQMSVFMTKKEIDNGTEIPHEIVVAGCVEKLASKEYSIDLEEEI